MKDSHIDYFLEKLARGELIYKDGCLYRRFSNKGNVLETPIIAGSKNAKGYIQLRATVGGKEITSVAHRVIWAYFYGRENLKKDLEINHKNGIKDDNRIDNLELITNSENELHAYRMNLRPRLLGELNPDSRLCTRQVLRIKELINLGLSNTEIAKIFGVTSINIRHIRRGRTWSEVTGFSEEAKPGEGGVIPCPKSAIPSSGPQSDCW